MLAHVVKPRTKAATWCIRACNVIALVIRHFAACTLLTGRVVSVYGLTSATLFTCCTTKNCLYVIVFIVVLDVG